MHQLVVLWFCIASVYGYGYYEGEDCSIDGVKGTCTLYSECESAKKDYEEHRRRPKICSWSNRDSVVCCQNSLASRGQSAAVTTSTTEYVPVLPDYDDDDDGSGCKKIAPHLTAPRNGKKAWDKCIDYQEGLVYPCNKSMALIGGLTRHNYCHHTTDTLILGGEDAAALEFPHMVLLGYVDSAGKVKWECAGTIISERYVLTAAHCTSHRDHGEVRFIRAGALSRSSPYERRQVYKVAKITKHPEYASPNKYNDIALLKTERPLELDSTMVPACLDMLTGVEYDMAIVTGWGYTRQGGGEADKLQRVILNKFTPVQCRYWYRPGTRNMQLGYQDDSQICYGDPQLLSTINNKNKNQKPIEFKDACQGDSGGPVQVKNKKLGCMYTVIGVTSFGRGCGAAPGIYTRVSKYVPWIESVVWPADALDGF